MAKFWIVIILEIMGIVTVVTLKNEVLDDTVFVRDFKEIGNLYLSNYQDIEITKVEDLEVKAMGNLLTKRYYGGEKMTDVFRYSLNSKALEKGDVLDFLRTAPDQVLLLFRNSYPMVSLEEMGVKTEEEAYQALQLAIWEIGDRVGDTKYRTEEARVKALRAYLGEDKINARVFDVASKLVHFSENWDAEQDSLDVQGALYITTKKAFKNLQNVSGKYLVGPFTYRFENGLVKNADIYGTDENGNSVKIDIYDENGKIVNNFKNVHNKNFYVAFPKDVKSFHLSLIIYYYHMQGLVYEKASSDYVARAYNVLMKETEIPVNVTGED